MQANPVIVKELRGRMRGWRAAIVLTFYLVVLAGVTMLFYGVLKSTSQQAGPASAQIGAQIGKFIFSALVVFQTIMVSLLTPAFTAGSITSEKEQKTYDLLMTTLLPARSVIFGKLGSALAYVVLLIIAVAPIESLAFLFGGVAPEEIILSQVVMLAAAVFFASVGIFWSTVVRTSTASNVLTYGTILFQMIGIPLLWYTITTSMGAYTPAPGGNPPLSQTEGFWYTSGVVLSLNPLAAMVSSETLLSRGDPLFIYTSTTLINGKTLLVVHPWLLSCIEALLLSGLLVFFATRLVRPVRARRARRSQAARVDALAGHGYPVPPASEESASPPPAVPPPPEANDRAGPGGD